MSHSSQPPFRLTFFHPKYWGLWLGIGLWRLILWLPYPLLYKIGLGLGRFLRRFAFAKRRIAIARRNLELCFPDKSPENINVILEAHIQSIGMAIIETGMAWFWSDRRIKKWSSVQGIEYLNTHLKDGIILVGVHFLTLELGARILGIHQPGIGVFRPNDNPLMNYLQIKGRLRSNKSLLDRKDLRGMIKALRRGNIIWYAPDHDYGRKNAVFVPFFQVQEAATTTGSAYLLKASPKSKVIPFSPLRQADGSGYRLEISPPVDFSDLNDEHAIALRMNQVVEKEILKGVAQYMWLHRRFKTRPDGKDGSLYENIL